MELKKRLDFRVFLVGIYVLAFGVYVLLGLQPVEAHNYEISADLAIPSIDLKTEVAALEPKDGILETPDYIAGSYSRSENKILIIGHSSTVFENLNEVNLDSEIFYDGLSYNVEKIELFKKSDIKMRDLLRNSEEKTLVLMTCAGEDLGGGDATHRLIITAEAE